MYAGENFHDLLSPLMMCGKVSPFCQNKTETIFIYLDALIMKIYENCKISHDSLQCVTFDHMICYCGQGPVIDVGHDYSKDRKNDYIAETDDGYVGGCLYV